MTDWRAVRRLVPEVLGALVRRYGHFDACEDAVQEALVAAPAQWPVQGWPEADREVRNRRVIAASAARGSLSIALMSPIATASRSSRTMAELGQQDDRGVSAMRPPSQPCH